VVLGSVALLVSVRPQSAPLRVALVGCVAIWALLLVMLPILGITLMKHFGVYHPMPGRAYWWLAIYSIAIEIK